MNPPKSGVMPGENQGVTQIVTDTLRGKSSSMSLDPLPPSDQNSQ